MIKILFFDIVWNTFRIWQEGNAPRIDYCTE